VETRLKSLQSLWIGEARLVRAEIAKHVERITLPPEGRPYTSGTWDLLGCVAVTMVPGARHARYCHRCNLGWLLKEWPRKMRMPWLRWVGSVAFAPDPRSVQRMTTLSVGGSGVRR
jgi:hypothetical protein